MRQRARTLVGVGACLAFIAMGVVAAATLSSQRVPFSGNVAIADVAALPDGKATKVVVPLLAGLDEKERQERGLLGYFNGLRTPHNDGLPVYVVRDGNDVEAFIGIDPRNGCDLALLPNPMANVYGSTIFHDQCHGALYDLHGNIVGGPAIWSLDQLAVTVRDGRVYALAGTVIPGRMRPRF